MDLLLHHLVTPKSTFIPRLWLLSRYVHVLADMDSHIGSAVPPTWKIYTG